MHEIIVYRGSMSSRSFKFASLPLQVALYFNGWYLALFYVAEAFLLVYKGMIAGVLYLDQPLAVL